MLVQRRADALRLIRQNDHALLAARLAQEWRGPHGRDGALPFRAVLAVALHDLAWAGVDAEPEWDDESKQPRRFNAVSDAYRETIYAPGLDAVESIDAYAALIASLHYGRFLPEDSDFSRAERRRRERLIAALPPDVTADKNVEAHRGLLRHLDFLSLFLLIGDPGGRDTPEWLEAGPVGDTAPGGPLTLRWTAPETVTISPFPFSRPLRLVARARDLPLGLRSAAELQDAWRTAAPRDVAVTISP